MARHPHRALVEGANGQRHRSISEHEAWNLIEGGDAIRLSRIKERPLRIRLSPRKAGNECVAASISAAEMQSNVGLNGPRIQAMRTKIIQGRRRSREIKFVDPERLGNFVDEAMYKIEVWPAIGDTRAIRVGPRVAV